MSSSGLEDMFKELEEQLSTINQIGTTPLSSEAQLREEISQWKRRTADAEDKANLLESKMKKLLVGVKEERSLHQKQVDELTERTSAAEDRANSLEEKILKLIELIKRERAERLQPSQDKEAVPREVQQKLAMAEERAAIAEERAANAEASLAELSVKVEKLEEIMDTEKQQYEFQTLELSGKLHILQQNEISTRKVQEDATRLEKEQRSKISQLEEQVRICKLALENVRKSGPKPTSNTQMDQLLEDAEARARQAEELAEEYSAKLIRLVDAVKKERAIVRDQIQESERKATTTIQQLKDRIKQLETSGGLVQSSQELEDRVRELEGQVATVKQQEEELHIAQETILRLEKQLQDNSLQGTNFNIPSEEPGFEAGPPPPPPPMPDLKIIDSTKITIKSDSSPANSPRTPNPNTASYDLINEIKKGVKLRSAAERKPNPNAPRGDKKIDMGNLGLMASELAKQRQKRIQGKPQQPGNTKTNRRESHTLNELLKELDSL